MSAQGFVLGMNAASTLNIERGSAVRVRTGDARLARHNELEDDTLTAGDAMPLPGVGAAMISAQHPTLLLELYRQDPIALREQITRQACRARNEGIRAFFARFFG